MRWTPLLYQLLYRIPARPYSVPDCLSLILANVTPHLKLWPLHRREMASKHYWGPGLVVAALRGWQPAICPVFCPTRPSPKSGEADRSETDFCRLSSDCKSRPGCHTSDHHTPDPAVQPKIIKGLVAKNSLDLLIYKCFAMFCRPQFFPAVIFLPTSGVVLI